MLRNRKLMAVVQLQQIGDFLKIFSLSQILPGNVHHYPDSTGPLLLLPCCFSFISESLLLRLPEA